ncbi:MAG: response regulator [Bacteroidota bacterium]
MSIFKIMIVEDEIIIAETLRMYLEQKGYEVSGIACSYEEAVELTTELVPDLYLLDIRLNGKRTGIDFAQYILDQEIKSPFIFLTSQLDARSIDRAKRTYPAGYLSKPFHKESLYTTIEIALHNYGASKSDEEGILELSDGSRHFRIRYSEIKFLQADHVYVKVQVGDKKPILQRCTLRDLMDQLPTNLFVQTHRSFVINLDRVTRWDKQHLYIDEQLIPISRSRKKDVIEYLKVN